MKERKTKKKEEKDLKSMSIEELFGEGVRLCNTSDKRMNEIREDANNLIKYGTTFKNKDVE